MVSKYNFLNNDKALLKFLFDAHFSGNAELNIQDIPESFANVCDSWVFTRRLGTDDLISWPVNSSAPYKSPGKDGIFSVLLQNGYEILKHALKRILTSSLATGYSHPHGVKLT